MIDEKILIERLEEKAKRDEQKAMKTDETEKISLITALQAMADRYTDTIQIVNQLAEEQNNGWIPCERELPEIGTLVLATTESGNVCEEVLIYDYMHSKAKEPCFHRWDDEMWECYTPRVIAWQPLPAPYQPKE